MWFGWLVVLDLPLFYHWSRGVGKRFRGSIAGFWPFNEGTYSLIYTQNFHNLPVVYKNRPQLRNRQNKRVKGKAYRQSYYAGNSIAL